MSARDLMNPLDTGAERACADDALDAIGALLDGVEWTSDTTAEIAQIVRTTGRVVRDSEDDDAPKLCRCGAEIENDNESDDACFPCQGAPEL